MKKNNDLSYEFLEKIDYYSTVGSDLGPNSLVIFCVFLLPSADFFSI